MEQVTIRTSEPEWFRTLATAYKKRAPVLLIDDANVGVDPAQQTLLQMGKHAALSPREWSAVLIALGVGAAGVWMIVAAIVDPEPTSKLGMLILGGAVFLGLGGFSAIKTLTGHQPPTIEVTKLGFRLHWP